MNFEKILDYVRPFTLVALMGILGLFFIVNIWLYLLPNPTPCQENYDSGACSVFEEGHSSHINEWPE